MYAEVILPLPLYGNYTYAVPPEYEGRISVGSRVIVPFGSRRYYTGVVESLTPLRPDVPQVKAITSVLDSYAIIRHPQLRFWHWIADYYLCSVGDVYRAALPSGLKIESETAVELNPDPEAAQAITRLCGDEPDGIAFEIVKALGAKGKLTPKELQKRTGIDDAALNACLSRLVSRQALVVSEKLVERYRKLKRTMVRLKLQCGGSEADTSAPSLQTAFAMVKSARRQELSLVQLVQLSHYSAVSGTRPEAVSREALLANGSVTWTAVKELEKKGLVEIFTTEVSRFSYDGIVAGELPQLSEAQSTALSEIHTAFKTHSVTLLHGVTSGGKTEIYSHLIDYVLRRGLQCLFLVPEIALTTQLTRRMQRIFGDKVVIYHSKFSDAERVEIWQRLLHSTEPLLVIGARSAVFLPFAKLGLVVIDEEHEPSYKQYDPAPRYNGRDAALVLASMHGAKSLMGSATPSIETYYKAVTGKYGLVSLTTRYGNVSLPKIQIVDMHRERQRGAVKEWLSDIVTAKARETIAAGKQVIFFHNRRGFAPMARCKQCQFIPKCNYCDVPLTYHRHDSALVCHYCGASYPVPRTCPNCHEPAIEIVGYGTERVADDIAARFADVRTLRMDLDTTRSKEGYGRIIDAFSAHEADVLVGTQMVTKGLDFGDVGMVCVVNADMIINTPDFRSSERAFNMLEQVSGRAGRRDEEGLVVIQAYKTDAPVLSYVSSHDYRGFYEYELNERRKYLYPPFCRVINIYIEHRDHDTAQRHAAAYAAGLRRLFGNRASEPIEPAVARVQSLYIRRVMLKVESGASMQRVKEYLRSLYEEMLSSPDTKGLMIYYDVDPA